MCQSNLTILNCGQACCFQKDMKTKRDDDVCTQSYSSTLLTEYLRVEAVAIMRFNVLAFVKMLQSNLQLRDGSSNDSFSA